MKQETLSIKDLEIEVYSFELMDSKMYVIEGQGTVLIVDPYEEPEVCNKLNGKKVMILLTHEHFDHISGVNYYASRYECTVYGSRECAKRVQSSKDNLASRFAFLFITEKEKYHYIRNHFDKNYTCEVTHVLNDGEVIKFENHSIVFHYLGGHSPGSGAYILDEQILFVGDNYLQNGYELRGTDCDKLEYENVVIPFLNSITQGIYFLPGHGGVKTEIYKT